MHTTAIGTSAGWHLAGCSCGWTAPAPRNLKVCAQADALKHRQESLAQAGWKAPQCQDNDCPVCANNYRPTAA